MNSCLLELKKWDFDFTIPPKNQELVCPPSPFHPHHQEGKLPKQKTHEKKLEREREGEGEGEGKGERELAFLLSFLSNSWLLCFLANAKVVLQIAVMTTPPLPPLLPPPPPPSPSSPSPPLSPSCFPPTLSLSLSLSLLLLALPHHLPRSRAAVSLPRPFSPSAQ